MDDQVEIVIQVMGKLVTRLDIDINLDKEEVEELALKSRVCTRSHKRENNP